LPCAITSFSLRICPPRSSLFPYTTLFRSELDDGVDQRGVVTFDQILDEAAVNLDLVQGQALQVAEGGVAGAEIVDRDQGAGASQDRQSTRLNSSHVKISYAGFCLKKRFDV